MKNYIRNILIFVITFSLVFGLCIIPSYADTLTPYLLPIAEIGTKFGKTINNNLIVYKQDANAAYYRYGASSDTVNTYVFAYILNNIKHYTLVPSTGQYVLSSSGNNPLANTHCSGIYENIYYYEDYNLNDTNTVYSDNIPIYSTKEEGLAACANVISGNIPIEDTPYNAYFYIPCGNVAYIKTGNDNTLTLSCTMPEYSKLTGSTGSYWTNTMQIAYGVPSYPPTGTTFPLSSMSGIQWFRSTEGRDLLGRTKKALFLDTTQGSDNFIVIYNPTYRELTTSGQGDINPTIRVQCSALIDYHIYALTGEYNSQGTISSYSIDGFSDPYVGTPTSDGEEVTGTNSSGSIPSVGGTGNDIGGDGGIIQYIQGIQKTLDTFANSFISLMKAPISHIQSLIAAGTDYFNMIRGLYGWLPDEVQGTINSAMIVSISVGVIALLL